MSGEPMTEPELVRITAATMYELRPQMLQLLAAGWRMAEMTKPIAEGFGDPVVAWFERAPGDYGSA